MDVSDLVREEVLYDVRLGLVHPGKVRTGLFGLFSRGLNAVR